MKKYLSILRLGWLDALEYRTEFFISILGWGIRLFIAVFLWMAVIEARGGQIGNYSLPYILTYFFIVQIIGSFTFSRMGFDISRDIYRGDFANFLIKPINYLLFRLTHEISKNVFRTILSVLIFGGLIVSFSEIPVPLWKILGVPLVVIGAYLINFCLVAIIALSSFWITNANRLIFIYFGIFTTFSGMIFPIDLFPPQLFSIFQFLPFPYIFFFPARIIQTAAIDITLMQGFVIQWAFVFSLGALLFLIYRLGVKRFEAVGR